ncbi:MAG: nucleotidyltransferase domain-containing protein [Deltaproteobacteria bacterium]|jgi:predicted nucleotidyltransferase|nr:nucleotidyltransferase domain-containing protein [Deltaproteobacteria bacterium]
MVFDLETVKATVKIYADEVRQVMPISKVYLYGSYAKGTPNEHSDVDVCFFLTYMYDENCINIMCTLLNLSHKYELWIEPYFFEVSDLETDNPFVKEILRTGIEIH